MKEFVVMDCVNTSAPPEMIREIVRAVTDVEVGPTMCAVDHPEMLGNMFPYLMEKDGEEYMACFFNCLESQKIEYEAKLQRESKLFPHIAPYYGLYFKEIPGGQRWQEHVRSLYEENGFKKKGKRTKSIKEYLGK